MYPSKYAELRAFDLSVLESLVKETANEKFRRVGSVVIENLKTSHQIISMPYELEHEVMLVAIKTAMATSIDSTSHNNGIVDGPVFVQNCIDKIGFATKRLSYESWAMNLHERPEQLKLYYRLLAAAISLSW